MKVAPCKNASQPEKRYVRLALKTRWHGTTPAATPNPNPNPAPQTDWVSISLTDEQDLFDSIVSAEVSANLGTPKVFAESTNGEWTADITPYDANATYTLTVTLQGNDGQEYTDTFTIRG